MPGNILSCIFLSIAFGIVNNNLPYAINMVFIPSSDIFCAILIKSSCLKKPYFCNLSINLIPRGSNIKAFVLFLSCAGVKFVISSSLLSVLSLVSVFDSVFDSVLGGSIVIELIGSLTSGFSGIVIGPL